MGTQCTLVGFNGVSIGDFDTLGWTLRQEDRAAGNFSVDCLADARRPMRHSGEQLSARSSPGRATPCGAAALKGTRSDY
jgi:hypothetical protein